MAAFVGRGIRTHASMDVEKDEKIKFLRVVVGVTTACVAAHVAYLKQPDAWRERVERWLAARVAGKVSTPREAVSKPREAALPPPDGASSGAAVQVRLPASGAAAEPAGVESTLSAAKARARAAGCAGLRALLWGRDASCTELEAEVVRARQARTGHVSVERQQEQ